MSTKQLKGRKRNGYKIHISMQRDQGGYTIYQWISSKFRRSVGSTEVGESKETPSLRPCSTQFHELPLMSADPLLNAHLRPPPAAERHYWDGR